MDNDEILRQEAVGLFLQGFSVHEVAQRVTQSRQWVYKWVHKYQESGKADWYASESNAPKEVPNKTSVRDELAVIEIRNRLASNPYSQRGAISIIYEFERLGLKPPTITTVNRILKRNKLVGPNLLKQRKQKEYPCYFVGVQQMDLIGPKYLKGGFKFYFYTIIDTDNHYAFVYPIKNKSAKSIAPCLIDFWQNYQIPDFLQMDNELSFRGSNRHPRGLGLLLRIMLDSNVSPIFIPPAEPWRNGIIEKFNDTVLKHFYGSQTFSSFEEIKEKAIKFSIFHNENHRYSSQSNRTPIQMTEPLDRRIRLKKQIDINSKISPDSGRLIFIRFIRSDLKLSILNTTFALKPELKYSYVVAEITIERHVLVVKQNTKIHHVFPFIMPLS
jgi:transposase-like protein/transposase InsO family protein